MARLKNPKEEQFAQALARDQQMHDSEIYNRIWNNNSGRSNASSTKKRIQPRIDEIRSEIAVSSTYDENFLLGRLIQILDRCMEGVARRDRQGNETGWWTFDAKGALRAVEMLGLERSMFVRRSEVKVGKMEPLTGTQEEIVQQLNVLANRIGYALVPLASIREGEVLSSEASH
jgi:hypothetical protein